MCRSILLSSLIFLFFTQIVRGAEIYVLPERVQGHEVIVIKGELIQFDEERFDSVALKVEKGLVLLDSPGGDVWAGINIGKSVRLRKYVTGVIENSLCASACGLIWLAGNERVVFPGGKLGFHAAYRMESGKTTESGAANAVVGAYLNQLGLNYQSIEWFTTAGPESMRWLTEVTARDLGIAAYFVPGQTDTAVVPKEQVAQADPIPGNQGFVALFDRDIYGFDLGSAVELNDISSCQKLCESTRGCRAYSFNRPKRYCFLKSGGRHVFWNKNVSGGYDSQISNQLEFLRIVLVTSTALEGKTYDVLPGLQLDQCAKRCNDRRAARDLSMKINPHNFVRSKKESCAKGRNRDKQQGLKLQNELEYCYLSRLLLQL